MKLRYITDPGHGWLEVPRGLLEILGIQDKITRYSYINNGYVYLEEDLDMQTFVQALKAASNIELELEHVYQEHTAVRDYDQYVVDTVSI
jgi:hypothetical protein